MRFGALHHHRIDSNTFYCVDSVVGHSCCLWRFFPSASMLPTMPDRLQRRSARFGTASWRIVSLWTVVIGFLVRAMFTFIACSLRTTPFHPSLRIALVHRCITFSYPSLLSLPVYPVNSYWTSHSVPIPRSERNVGNVVRVLSSHVCDSLCDHLFSVFTSDSPFQFVTTIGPSTLTQCTEISLCSASLITVLVCVGLYTFHSLALGTTGA